MRFVKPLDEQTVARLAAGHALLVTVEENAVMGGAGSAVGEYLAARESCPAIIHIGVPDRFVEQGSRGELLEECGLTAESILGRIYTHLKHHFPQMPAVQINSH